MEGYTLIDIDIIDIIKNNYPKEFDEFCIVNKLKPPDIKSMNGKALSVMLDNPNKYWTRETCDEFIQKFKIKTKDSIQLFNKHAQWGIKTGNEKGKNYIIYPYCLSNKQKIRKNLDYNCTNEEKNCEINKIKSTIKNDYIDVSNDQWHIGHKNPEPDYNIENKNNIILQPPIQAKYRDKFIFIDTLTKIPTPKTLIKMIDSNDCPYTNAQLKELQIFFITLKL
jgi:hypothetical protein